MATFIALLRAVNVGGTGKLPMSDLKRLCEEIGLREVRTYIASGNVVFESDGSAAEAKAVLERALEGLGGRPVGVIVRRPSELETVLAENPFPDAARNTTVAIFLDEPPPADTLERLGGQDRERVALGRREIYVAYGPTMGRTKLRIPAARDGTARNFNTIMKLAAMAADGSRS